MLPTVLAAYTKPLIVPTLSSRRAARRIMYGEITASTKHGKKNTSVLPSTGSSFFQSAGMSWSKG